MAKKLKSHYINSSSQASICDRINQNKSMSLRMVSSSKSAHGSYVSIFHWLYQFPLQNIHLNFLIFIQHNLKHIHSEYLDVHDIAEARTCYDGLEFEVNSAFNRICKNDSGMHHFIQTNTSFSNYQTTTLNANACF